MDFQLPMHIAQFYPDYKTNSFHNQSLCNCPGKCPFSQNFCSAFPSPTKYIGAIRHNRLRTRLKDKHKHMCGFPAVNSINLQSLGLEHKVLIEQTRKKYSQLHKVTNVPLTSTNILPPNDAEYRSSGYKAISNPTASMAETSDLDEVLNACLPHSESAVDISESASNILHHLVSELDSAAAIESLARVLAPLIQTSLMEQGGCATSGGRVSETHFGPNTCYSSDTGDSIYPYSYGIEDATSFCPHLYSSGGDDSQEGNWDRRSRTSFEYDTDSSVINSEMSASLESSGCTLESDTSLIPSITVESFSDNSEPPLRSRGRMMQRSPASSRENQSTLSLGRRSSSSCSENSSHEATVPSSNGTTNKFLRCSLCNSEDHTPQDCQVDKTSLEYMVIEKGLCRVCLLPGHLGYTCPMWNYRRVLDIDTSWICSAKNCDPRPHCKKLCDYNLYNS